MGRISEGKDRGTALGDLAHGAEILVAGENLEPAEGRKDGIGIQQLIF